MPWKECSLVDERFQFVVGSKTNGVYWYKENTAHA